MRPVRRSTGSTRPLRRRSRPPPRAPAPCPSRTSIPDSLTLIVVPVTSTPSIMNRMGITSGRRAERSKVCVKRYQEPRASCVKQQAKFRIYPLNDLDAVSLPSAPTTEVVGTRQRLGLLLLGLPAAHKPRRRPLNSRSPIPAAPRLPVPRRTSPRSRHSSPRDRRRSLPHPSPSQTSAPPESHSGRRRNTSSRSVACRPRYRPTSTLPAWVVVLTTLSPCSRCSSRGRP